MTLYTLDKKFSTDFQIPNKKPVGEVEIDWSNPLTKGLVGCYADGDISRNLVTNHTTTKTTIDPIKSQFGAGQEGTTSTSLIDTNENPISFSGSNNRTLIIGINYRAIPGLSNATLFGIGVNDTSERWDLRHNNGDLRVEIQGSGYTTSLALTGGFRVVGIKLDGTTLGDHTIYLDRLSEASSGGATVNTSTSMTGRFLNSVAGSRGWSNSDFLFGYLFNRALTDAEYLAIQANPYQLLKPKTPPVYFTPSATGISVTVTGTAIPTQTEAGIVTGGKTIILTLTGDTFVTGTTSLDGIAGGSDSDIAASGTNWDSLIKTALDNTDVVLSVGDTVATITLPAFGAYDTDVTETITWTIPAASLTTSATPVIATPTHTITSSAASVLTADSGTYTYTGTDAALLIARVLNADSGTYNYTGTNANLVRGLVLNANTGAYGYTGADATLTFTPAGAFTLVADSGVYAYTGTDINFSRDRVIIASSGTYTYSGTDIQIILPGQIWTDKPAVSTTWTNQDSVVTTWTNQAATTTIWTDK